MLLCQCPCNPAAGLTRLPQSSPPLSTYRCQTVQLESWENVKLANNCNYYLAPVCNGSVCEMFSTFKQPKTFPLDSSFVSQPIATFSSSSNSDCSFFISSTFSNFCFFLAEFVSPIPLFKSTIVFSSKVSIESAVHWSNSEKKRSATHHQYNSLHSQMTLCWHSKVPEIHLISRLGMSPPVVVSKCSKWEISTTQAHGMRNTRLWS